MSKREDRHGLRLLPRLRIVGVGVDERVQAVLRDRFYPTLPSSPRPGHVGVAHCHPTYDRPTGPVILHELLRDGAVSAPCLEVTVMSIAIGKAILSSIREQ